MKIIDRLSYKGALPLLWLAGSTPLYAVGFYLPNQSVQATSRGNAWVATADSPAAVHYNPAGLNQLDSPSLEAGVYAVYLGYEHESAIDGQTYKNAKNVKALPHLYYAQPINDDTVMGFGLTAPFGLGTEYDPDTPFRDLTIEALLKYVRFSGVVSYELFDGLSIGGGLGLDYADALLERGIVDTLSPFPNDSLRFEGTGAAMTWVASLLWKPHEQHSFGATYHSAGDFVLKGDVSSTPVGFGLPKGDAKIDFYSPAVAAVGYAFKPNDRLTLEANVEWVDWDGLNTLVLRGEGLGPLQVPVPFEYESSFIYEVGLSYELTEHCELNLGWVYNESSVPDTFYSPAIPDSNLQSINVGLNIQKGDLKIQTAYQFAFSEYDVENSIFPSNGEYKTRHHAFMLAAILEF